MSTVTPITAFTTNTRAGGPGTQLRRAGVMKIIIAVSRFFLRPGIRTLRRLLAADLDKC
jgi:hypothetical protein